jgi:aromatic-L-amino-acid decarboxylase
VTGPAGSPDERGARSDDWWKRIDQPLDLTPDQAVSLVQEVLPHLHRFFATLCDASSPEPAAAGAEDSAAYPAYRPTVRFPEQRRASADVLPLLLDQLARPLTSLPSHPSFVSYVAGGGIFHAAVAQLVAMALNPYTAHYSLAPGLVRVEVEVIGWLCDMVGYPPESFGILTTGGSLATLSAVVAARAAILPDDFRPGTIYMSDQANHCLTKAAYVAGFSRDNLRVVASSPGDDRIDTRALQAAIAADRRRGLRPFLLAGTAGTTSTGAIDDLAELGRIARAEGMWFHVDGAYGAMFLLTEHGRQRMAGLEGADSIVVDPHKSMCLPYGTGCLLVRERRTLAVGHDALAPYMPDLEDGWELPRVDFSELTPELSRDFRGLRIWLPVQLLGIGPFRDNLLEKLAMTRWVLAELRAIEHIEVLVEPQLTVLAFAMSVDSPDGGAQATRELLSRINACGNLCMTTTTLHGRLAIRMCLLSFRVHFDRVERGVADIRTCAAEVARRLSAVRLDAEAR